MEPQKHIAVGILILVNSPKHGRAALLMQRPPHTKKTRNDRITFQATSFGNVYQVTAHARLDDNAYGPACEDLKTFLPSIMAAELGGPAARFIYNSLCWNSLRLLYVQSDDKCLIETYGLSLDPASSLEFEGLLITAQGTRKLFLTAGKLGLIKISKAKPEEKSQYRRADVVETGEPTSIKMFADEYAALCKLLLGDTSPNQPQK